MSQRKGRFELADGGTLFLDEVGDIPPAMQVKLLRVLQERAIRARRKPTCIEVDVRVVAATNRSLSRLVRREFREDLYYRLNVVRVELPPLRERQGDIPLLATHFAEKYKRTDTQYGRFRRRRCRSCCTTPGRATSANWRTPLSEPAWWRAAR